MAYVPLSFGRVVSGGGGSAIGTLPITSNGNYNVESYAGVAVSVSPRLQNKAVGASESLQIVEPDSGFDGLLSVEVAAIPSTYMGSAIPTMSGSVVTPTETLQTVVSANTYVTESVIMNPIPASYVVPSGTYSISANGTYGVSEYVSVAVNVSSDDRAFIERTLTVLSNSGATYVASNAFQYAKNLTEVNLPNCSYVGSSAFYYCTSLATANLPSCTEISASAFASCTSLLSVSLPEVTTIGSGAFSRCYSLQSVDIPECSNIGSNAFYACTSLSALNASGCLTVQSSAFASCNRLALVDFPLCETIGRSAFMSCFDLPFVQLSRLKSLDQYAFYNCSSISFVSLPACETISAAAFGVCASLVKVYLPAVTNMGPQVFGNCYSVSSFYFTGTSVPTILTSTFSFTTLDLMTTGTIYVRASMLSAFATATNWTQYSARMVGLTDAQIAAL